MKIVIEVLFIAFAVAFLIGWGLIKKQRKQEELYKVLINKCKKKILNGFKSNQTLSKKDIENIIKGTKGSLLWSKQQAQIQDARIFSDTIINLLIEQSLIQKNNKNKYELVER